MKCCKEAIFGPVLLCIKAYTLEDAIKITNNSSYGNGTAIFTNSDSVEATQIGINLPIPVSLPFCNFTGGKSSFRGATHFYGKIVDDSMPCLFDIFFCNYLDVDIFWFV